jgi:hypothetical protein
VAAGVITKHRQCYGSVRMSDAAAPVQAMLTEWLYLYCCTCHTLRWVLTYCWSLVHLQEIGVQVEEPFGILALEVRPFLACSCSQANHQDRPLSALKRHTYFKPARSQCAEHSVLTSLLCTLCCSCSITVMR